MEMSEQASLLKKEIARLEAERKQVDGELDRAKDEVNRCKQELIVERTKTTRVLQGVEDEKDAKRGLVDSLGELKRELIAAQAREAALQRGLESAESGAREKEAEVGRTREMMVEKNADLELAKAEVAMESTYDPIPQALHPQPETEIAAP